MELPDFLAGFRQKKPMPTQSSRPKVIFANRDPSTHDESQWWYNTKSKVMWIWTDKGWREH